MFYLLKWCEFLYANALSLAEIGSIEEMIRVWALCPSGVQGQSPRSRVLGRDSPQKLKAICCVSIA